MENRENIVAHYFRLRVLLNRANFKMNDATEIRFAIYSGMNGHFHFFANLKGIRKTQKLELCNKNADFPWSASGHSGLIYLEEHCASLLQKKFSTQANDLDLKKIVLEVHSELRGLGVPA